MNIAETVQGIPTPLAGPGRNSEAMPGFGSLIDAGAGTPDAAKSLPIPQPFKLPVTGKHTQIVTDATVPATPDAAPGTIVPDGTASVVPGAPDAATAPATPAPATPVTAGPAVPGMTSEVAPLPAEASLAARKHAIGTAELTTPAAEPQRARRTGLPELLSSTALLPLASVPAEPQPAAAPVETLPSAAGQAESGADAMFAPAAPLHAPAAPAPDSAPNASPLATAETAVAAGARPDMPARAAAVSKDAVAIGTLHPGGPKPNPGTRPGTHARQDAIGDGLSLAADALRSGAMPSPSAAPMPVNEPIAAEAQPGDPAPLPAATPFDPAAAPSAPIAARLAAPGVTADAPQAAADSLPRSVAASASPDPTPPQHARPGHAGDASAPAPQFTVPAEAGGTEPGLTPQADAKDAGAEANRMIDKAASSPVLRDDAAAPPAGERGASAPRIELPAAPAAPDRAPVQARADAAPPAQPATTEMVARAGHLGNELGLAIARRVQDGDETLRIRLKPVELGQIEVTLRVDDGGRMQAVLRAEQPAALELLRREAGDLGRALEQAGIRADAQSFRFESRSEGGQQQQQGGQQQRSHGAPAQRADDSDFIQTDAPYRALRGDGRVDMIA